jgi:hypothetical protein
MKIYDCFTFFNEFDLLEIRLKELYEVVDKFVIVEGNTTFTNISKPFLFEENKERYKDYADKIIHVKVQMPMDLDPWINEKFQRDAISIGVQNADDNDVILITDLDEIPRADAIASIRKNHDTSIWALRMPLFYFKFNYLMSYNRTHGHYSTWGVGVRAKHLNSADELRRNRFFLDCFPYNHCGDGVRLIEHAGWQFSYLGGSDFAKLKIQSFSHTETNRPEIIDNIDIDCSIEKGDGLIHDDGVKFTAVSMDEYFPKEVVNNKEKYKDYIISKAEESVISFLPPSVVY